MPDSQQPYYVNTGNGPAGPYTLVAIHTMVRSGQLPANVQVCPPNGQAWMSLPAMEEDFFSKAVKWVKDKAVNGLFVNSEMLEVRVSFSGRTRRRSCIMTQLCILGLLILSILAIVLVVMFAEGGYHELRHTFGRGLTAILAYTFGLLLSLPFIAFSCWLMLVSLGTFVRRLHDIGLSGWFCLIGLVFPGIWPIIVYCIDSVPGANQWGTNPKGIEGDVYPNPYDGTGMPVAPVIPAPPYPIADQERPVAQIPVPPVPQPFAAPANAPVCPPSSTPPQQVGGSQALTTGLAPSDGAGVPATQSPLSNQAQPFTPQHQVVPPPPVALQVGAPPPFPACPPSLAVSAPGTKTMYYVLIAGTKQGPFEAQNIVQMLASGQVTADTPVCVEGMEQWLPIRQVQLV